MAERTGDRLRVSVVATDRFARTSLLRAMATLSDVEAIAWAGAVAQLLMLGTRADMCVCAVPPGRAELCGLHERGYVCVTAPSGTDPVAAVEAAMSRERQAAPLTVVRPQFSPRQREVVLAYVTISSLLPAVARELGMGPETLATHLRRIPVQYAEVGRSTLTRHDLYVRAVEDGLVPPPSGRH